MRLEHQRRSLARHYISLAETLRAAEPPENNNPGSTHCPLISTQVRTSRGPSAAAASAKYAVDCSPASAPCYVPPRGAPSVTQDPKPSGPPEPDPRSSLVCLSHSTTPSSPGGCRPLAKVLGAAPPRQALSRRACPALPQDHCLCCARVHTTSKKKGTLPAPSPQLEALLAGPAPAASN